MQQTSGLFFKLIESEGGVEGEGESGGALES
jgi:hypothetical protein